MYLGPEPPIGRPSFALSRDHLATAIDLLCRGSAHARPVVSPGMLEVPITILVKKAMLRLKRQLGLTNIEITGELELLDANDPSAAVQGRIDITPKFLHQFGDEEAYLGVECKRVAPDDSSLNGRYISQGVDRFATGKYGRGHQWGMMLAYVLKLPLGTLAGEIDNRITKSYGATAKLKAMSCHPDALSMHEGAVEQAPGDHSIRLIHLFVDMSPAGVAGKASAGAT